MARGAELGRTFEAAGQRARSLSSLVRTFGSALVREPIVRRRTWIVVASALVFAYALGVLAYVLATPEFGVRTAFNPIVAHFDEGFLFAEEQAPKGRAPLRQNDRIVQIGNQPIENWSQFLRRVLELRDVPAEVGTGLTPDDLRHGRASPDTALVEIDGQHVVRVVYERPGLEGRHTVWCRLGTSPVETVVPSVLWFFLKVGLFVVGALVFWQRPADRSAAQFFWLVIVSSGAYLGGYHWSRIVTQPVLLLVFMLCGAMLPAVTLHFYLLFPRPKLFFERSPRTALLIIYGPPVAFLSLLLSGYLRVRYLYSAGLGDGPISGLADGLLVEMLYEIYVYFAIAMLWYLASIGSLVHSFLTAEAPTERNQVKWILLGTAAAVVPMGYSLYLAFWEQGRFGGGAATWPMFAASAIVTAAYTVSITRYRLMQLDKIVSSGASYFLISSLAGLLYYGLVFAGVALVGSQVGEGPSFVQVLAVSTTALVLTGALDLARGRLKHALDRHFRREKYQLDRTLQRMSQAIDQLVDSPTLARRLLRTAAELLNVSRGAVYLRQNEAKLYHLTDALGAPPALAELSSGCPLVEALLTRGTLPYAGANGQGAAALRQLHFVGGEVAQGLLHEGQLLGLLVLGPKEAGSYTSEEVNLLAAFAQITVPALVSAEGHRTIEALNGELKGKVEKIAEQQRRILALQSQLLTQSQKQDERATRAVDRKEGTEREAPAPPLLPDGVVGSSPQVQQLMGLMRRVAASSSAVLLRGESGTGKELLARALHEHSGRAGKPFVKVHCAALSPGLLESELFGHVKGAFTSAIRDKVGRFEAADGGTLFLDEIGDISLEVQTKLLRVLEEMTFERVGSSDSMQVDVRVIAATHRNLETMIAAGTFREDLFFRLNVLPIALPPLRERVEDVAELAMHFLQQYSQKAGKEVTGIDDDALVLLKACPWPGNVRQLENAIERAVVIVEGTVVTVAELPPELRASFEPTRPRREGEDELPRETNGKAGGRAGPPNGTLTLPELAEVLQIEHVEREKRDREHLVRALAATGGNKAEAARALGLPRSTLVSKLKKYGLS